MGQVEGKLGEKKQFVVKMLEVFNLMVYHFEIGLLQLPSPLFQSLSKNSQFCVFSPQPPNLLFSLWGAALPLNTQGINITSSYNACSNYQCSNAKKENHKNRHSGRLMKALKRDTVLVSCQLSVLQVKFN